MAAGNKRTLLPSRLYFQVYNPQGVANLVVGKKSIIKRTSLEEIRFIMDPARVALATSGANTDGLLHTYTGPGPILF